MHVSGAEQQSVEEHEVLVQAVEYGNHTTPLLVHATELKLQHSWALKVLLSKLLLDSDGNKDCRAEELKETLLLYTLPLVMVPDEDTLPQMVFVWKYKLETELKKLSTTPEGKEQLYM
eukprot:RCo041758